MDQPTLDSEMSHVAGNGITEEFRYAMLLPEETRDPLTTIGGGGAGRSEREKIPTRESWDGVEIN